MISDYQQMIIIVTMVAFIFGMMLGILTVPYMKNKKKVDKKIKKIWKKIKIISIDICKTIVETGACWVLGMSIILLTRLYADSDLPNGWFFGTLWVLGCGFILMKMYIMYIGENEK